MKKFYLLLAGTLFLGTATVSANCNFENSKFELEWNQAYFRSCNEGIITDQSIDSAKLNQELSRIEMARMLNVFAKKFMKKEEDPSRKCTGYSDIINSYDIETARKSCYLGIMGIGIDKFRPNDSVSRAEFGTVLSRILYGDTYNVTSGKYYEKHLKALKDNGIITQNNPSIKERKGYILLMLKRYIDSNNSDKQNTEEVITFKNDNGYIKTKGHDVTISNNKDSITIDNIPVKNGDGKWSDSVQGACAPGYHVPSKDEAINLLNIWRDIRGDEFENAKKFHQDIINGELPKNNIVNLFRQDVGLSRLSNGYSCYWTRSYNYDQNSFSGGPIPICFNISSSWV